MDNHTFKEHLYYIREALQGHVDSDQYWFQFLANNQQSLTLPHRYPISIRPSQHGRGVFADCDIPRGTAITLYPAHYLCVKVKGDTHTVIHPEGLPPMDPAYRISISDTVSFVGCPEITDNQWFLGHMLNDNCNISSLKKGKEGKWLSHYREAEQKVNTRYERMEDCLYLVTMENIKAGQELFVSYGSDYWFTRAGLPTYKQFILSQKAKLPSHKRALLNALLHSDSKDGS